MKDLRVLNQEFEPSEIVIEVRARLGITVWKIDRRNDDAFDGRFQVATLPVGRITGQPSPNFFRRLPLGENSHAMMRSLPLPNRSVSSVLDCSRWKFRVVSFEFLEAHD